MNPETKNRIRALVNNFRSGKFKQIRQVLKRDDNERCALGCAYETYKEITGEGTWGNKIFILDEVESDAWKLMKKVADFFGGQLEIDRDKLTDDEKKDHYGRYPIPLYVLNDRGVPFTRIADLVEQQYLQETV